MNSTISCVPDLLRRFVATPHSSVFCIGNDHVRLETNDLSLADTIRNANVCREKSNAQEHSEWKLIRDNQAPCDGKDITIFSAGSIGTILLGTGTIIVVDRERREVFGFITPDISRDEMASTVLPLILDLLDSR
jgi:hypothetical protein